MAFQPECRLTAYTAEQALPLGVQAIAAGEREIDMSKVLESDSAGLATMVAWQRAAHKAGGRVKFLNVPLRLARLASLYGVAELLDLPDRPELSDLTSH